MPLNGATVTIADDGILSPGGIAPGTLTVDNLSLSAGSQLNFKLGQAGVAGGASNDLVIANGQLTLAGALNVTSGPFFTNGKYTLFTYGTITDNGVTLGTLPSGFTGTVAIVAGAGGGGAIVLQALGNSRQYWDGNGAVADHVVSGGSGTWNAGSFSWASADGSSNSIWGNQQAVFGIAGGLVTVAGTQHCTLLQFDVEGYHLTGDGLLAVSPDGVAAPEINTAVNTAAIVDNVISGTDGLLKSGLGTLTLNGNNSLFGAVSIGAGRVNAGSDGALGTGTVELFDATTLGAAAAVTLANSITLDNHATVDSNGFALTLGGPIGGAGSLTIADTGSTASAGLVTLTGTNSYLGDTTVTDARASVAADAALGDVASDVVLNGGTLLTTASFASARHITLTGDSQVAPADGTALTLQGIVDGSGSLRQGGAGTLVLTGTNSYAGGTFVNSGVLSVAADGNLGAAAGSLNLLGGTLQMTDNLTTARQVTIAQAGTIDTGAFAVVFNGPVTDTGVLTKIGSGSLALNGNNSSVAPTLLNQGSIIVDSSTAIGGGGLAMADGTTLAAGVTGLVLADAVTTAGIATIDSGGGSFTLNGTVGDAGSISKVGLGDLVLNGSNSFIGLDITAGTITVGSNTAAGAGAIVLGGATTLAAGAAGLTLANAITTPGAGAIDSGTGSFTLGGAITGNGSITKIGTGNLVLNGSNSFVGLSVNNGSIALGTNTAAGSGFISLGQGSILAAGATGLVVANAITAHGTDTLDSGTGVFTLTGIISGASSITKINSGNIVLLGANSFTGLDINAGEVTLGDNSAGGVGGIALADGTTLAAGVTGLGLTNAITTAGLGSVDSGAGTLTLFGTVWGPGSIVKLGSGNLLLAAGNSFNGLMIAAGTVTVDTNTSAGGGNISFVDGTTLAAGVAGLVLANDISTNGIATVRSGGLLTLNGVVSGPGTLATGEAGNLMLNGSNSFAALDLNFGTVTLGSNTAGGSGVIAMGDGTTLAAGIPDLVIANAVTTAGSGSIDSGPDSFTLNGVVSGAGSITKLGLGNLVLNGSNGFTGLAVTAGMVADGSNTAAGLGGIALSDGTTLAAGIDALVLANAVTTAGIGSVDSGAGGLTLGGPITGAGSITKIGAGNLALNGNNGFNGLTVNAGTVTVGNNSAAGSGTVSLASGTTLAAGTTGLVLANAVVTQGGSIDSGVGAFTLAGPVTGGSLTKLGAGTLTLTGNNSYAGPTSVAAGTLAVNGVNGGSGAVGVLAGATLTGGGSIAGTVTIADGATIAPGSGVGTLTTGGLVLGNAATLNYQLGQASVIGGASNDLLQVNGDLTLGGKLNVADSGGFSTGVYRLINYTGGLADNGLAVNSLPGVYAGLVQTIVPGTVTLLVTNPNTLVQYWDGTDQLGNGAIDGGGGSWTAGGSNWTSASPSTINSSWAGGVAVFAGTAGTVALTGTQAFEGLQFTVPDYVLTGGTLAASAGSFIATNGGTTTIGGAITGCSVTKQGAGTLALTGSNSFAALNITGGVVSLGTSTAGGTGNIALADGTMLVAGAAGLQLTNTLSTAGSGTIDTGANSLLLRGVVSGPGSMTKLGTGTLVFNNSANTFANLNVIAGTIMAAGGTSPVPDHSFGTGTISLADGTTLAGGGGVSELANAIVVTGTVQVDSGNAPPPPSQGPIGFLNLDGNISGSGSLVKVSTGGLGLNGTNSFSALVIASGSVSALASGVGSGSIALLDGTVFDGFGVFANAFSVTGSGTFGSRPMTLNGVVSGPGSVISTDTLVLNGVNSFTGLTISGGSVTIGNNSAPGNGTIALANGTTLAAGVPGLVVSNAVTTAGTGTLDVGAYGFVVLGAVSGPGSITKTGSGSLALYNVTNSFNGLNVDAGTVSVGTGEVAFNTSAGIGIVTLADATTLSGILGAGLANAIIVTGSTQVNSGDRPSNADPAEIFTLTGNISGSGSVTKLGNGNLVLGGSNSFMRLIVNAGTVILGTNTAAGTGSIALIDGTTLAAGVSGLVLSNTVSTAGAATVDSGAGVLTLAGPVTGAGSVTKVGAGNLVLTGSNSYAGATNVASGTLTVNGSNSGIGAVGISGGAALTGGGSIAGVVTVAGGATLSPATVSGR